MKYIQFTYVDSVTGVPVTQAPAINGPAFPAVKGLQFVWARESEYPTSTPNFFGTCDADADLSTPGVLLDWSQADFENLRSDEMRKRNPVPANVTMRQARLALLGAGLLDDVDAAIAANPDPVQRKAAQIEWEYANTVERGSTFVQQLGAGLGLTEQQLDELFTTAATL